MNLSPDQWDTLLGTPAPVAPYAPYGYDEWGNPLPAPPPIPSAIQTTAPVAAQAQDTYQQALDVAFNWTPPEAYAPAVLPELNPSWAQFALDDGTGFQWAPEAETDPFTGLPMQSGGDFPMPGLGGLVGQAFLDGGIRGDGTLSGYAAGELFGSFGQPMPEVFEDGSYVGQPDIWTEPSGYGGNWPADMQVASARRVFESLGLPGDIADYVKASTLPDQIGGGHYSSGEKGFDVPGVGWIQGPGIFNGSEEIKLGTYSINNDPGQGASINKGPGLLPGTAAHEAIHALEARLSPVARDELIALMRAYPPMPGSATDWHNVGGGGVSNNTAPGLTAYFDDYIDARIPIPESILEFIRLNAPRQITSGPAFAAAPIPEQGYQGLATGQQVGFDATGGETAGGSVADIVARQQANRAAMPSAWQSIIGMDTPSDLAADPTTPFNSAAPIDPFAKALSAIDWLSNVADSIPLLPGADRFGIDGPTTGEAVDAARNAILYGVEAAAKARTNVTPTGVYGGDPEASRAAADVFLPRSTLELGLEFLPGIGSVPDIRRGLRGVAGEALDELPEAAVRGAISSPLQNPASVPAAARALGGGAVHGEIDEALQLANMDLPKMATATRLLSNVVPSLKTPRVVQVANRAGEMTAAQAPSWIDPLKSAARQMQEAFDAAKPVYHGTDTTPDVGSAVHYLEHPWDYTPNTALDVARKAWDDANEAGLLRLKDEFGVEVNPFYVERNGVRNSYVPHLEDIDVIRARDLPKPKSRLTGQVVLEKERGIPTISDRLRIDPSFRPDLDLLSLAARHGAGMVEAATRATFKEGIGGLTKLDLAQREIPGLLKAREQLTQQVAALKDRAVKAGYKADFEYRAAGKADTAANNLEKKATKLKDRIDDLGANYGPELSHLSGELYQLSRWVRSVQEQAAKGFTEAGVQGAREATLTKQMDALIDRLDDIRKQVRTWHPNADNWVLDHNMQRYFPPKVAKGIDDISNNTENGLVRLLEEMRAVQLNGGDLSPLTFGRGQMGAFGYGKTMLQSPKLIANAVAQGDEIWRGVDQDALRIFQSLRRAPVTKPMLEIRPDDAKQGLEHIPGLGKLVGSANSTVNRLQSYAEFSAWEASARSIARRKGIGLDEAGAEAWRAMNTIAPRIDLGNYGMSRAAQRLLNAPFTSLSYMGATPQLAVNLTGAASSFAKNLATHGGNPAAAWKALRASDQEIIIHGIELGTMLSAISGASAALFGEGDMDERIADAMNPLGEKGWMLQTPLGDIPLATPLRAGVRTVNRVRKGQFNAAEDYVSNRLISGPSFLYHMIKNRDFAGEKILDGENRFMDGLLYALESSNILTSALIRTVRQGESITQQTGVDTIANQLGFSMYEDPPLSESSRNAISAAVDAGVFPAEMRDVLKGANWNDLTGTERTLLRNYAIQTGNKDLLADIEANERRLLRKDSIFAEKRDEVNDDWKAQSSTLDTLWNSLLTGKAPAKDVMDELSRIESGINATYDNREFDKAVAGLGDRNINKLMDDYYAFVDLSKKFNGGVPNWDMVEEARAKWFATLDPADAARVKLNVAGAVPEDAHVMRKFVAQMQPTIDAYYDSGDTKARETYREANPQADFVLWFLGIVSVLRSDEAVRLANQYAPERAAKRAER